MRLNKVLENETVIVTNILTLRADILYKLGIFGIILGAKIDVLSRAPFKSPIQLRVKNQLIALRAEEASFVEVQVVEERI